MILFPQDYVCIDTETTGLTARHCEIIEIACARVRGGEIVDSYSSLIKPYRGISPIITRVTGISPEMVENERRAEEVLPEALEFIGDDVILGQNVRFDIGFINAAARELDLRELDNDRIDTMAISRRFLPGLGSHSLATLAEHFGVVNADAHRAMSDVLTTIRVYNLLREMRE